jgi:hypothetical protein
MEAQHAPPCQSSVQVHGHVRRGKSEGKRRNGRASLVRGLGRTVAYCVASCNQSSVRAVRVVSCMSCLPCVYRYPARRRKSRERDTEHVPYSTAAQRTTPRRGTARARQPGRRPARHLGTRRRTRPDSAPLGTGPCVVTCACPPITMPITHQTNIPSEPYKCTRGAV